MVGVIGPCLAFRTRIHVDLNVEKYCEIVGTNDGRVLSAYLIGDVIACGSPLDEQLQVYTRSICRDEIEVVQKGHRRIEYMPSNTPWVFPVLIKK